jgi:hypothetical protein
MTCTITKNIDEKWNDLGRKTGVLVLNNFRKLLKLGRV